MWIWEISCSEVRANVDGRPSLLAGGLYTARACQTPSLLMMVVHTCAAACPSHCLECQVNSATGAVECEPSKCEPGYGIQDSDKTCVSK